MTFESALELIHGFVTKRDPSLAPTSFHVCPEIRVGARGKSRQRAFMHTFHEPGRICYAPQAKRLPLNHLVGIVLHEYGHLGSGGGEGEADQWVFAKLGIAIEYRGSLCLEWVDNRVVRAVLAGSNPMTTEELRQGARTAMSRRAVSLPMAMLSKRGLLVGRMLDYGCGRGQDADHFGMEKYDPTYFPTKPVGPFDTITCNYVLNVTPPRVEGEILADIRSLLAPGGTAYITVRRDVYADGVTRSGTYQRVVKLDLPVLHEKKGAFATYVMRA